MDETTRAWINLYAVLGAIPELCTLDESAKEMIKNKNTGLGFSVKGGPAATLVFSDGCCSFVEGTEHAQIKLPFSSPKKFNGMIDGTVTPIPSKGFTKIMFLLKTFTALTNRLTAYLQPKAEDLVDEDFFTVSTTLMFYVILRAIEQVGNHDTIGMFSAAHIVDGNVKLSIDGGPAGYLAVSGGHLSAHIGEPETCMSYMSFKDMHIARDLFDGKIGAVASIGTGDVRIGGMVLMVDNVNRILDRVALYLG